MVKVGSFNEVFSCRVGCHCIIPQLDGEGIVKEVFSSLFGAPLESFVEYCKKMNTFLSQLSEDFLGLFNFFFGELSCGHEFFSNSAENCLPLIFEMTSISAVHKDDKASHH